MKLKPSENKSLFSGFLKLSSGTLVSRVTGMFREMILAHYMGAGAVMDAFMVAFTMPNLFRRILGERVMESAMLPVYKQLEAAGRYEEAGKVLKSTMALVGGIGLIITGAGMALSPGLIHLFAPGFDPETHAIAVTMTRVMFPFLVLIGIASIFGATLLAHRKFAPYSFAPAIYNLVLIVMLGSFYKFWGPMVAAWAVLVGGALEGVFLFLFLPRLSGWRTAKIQLTDPSVKKINALSLPIILETIFDKTVVLFDRRLASLLDNAGSIAALGYAFRLLQLPYGVLALAVSRAYYPSLVESADDPDQFIGRVGSALHFIFCLMIPCAAYLYVFRELLVRVIFRHGAFDEEAVAMTGIAFACYGFGIIGMGVVSMLSRSFNALLDTRTPVFVSFGLMIGNICLNFILVKTPLEHAGLALASSLAYSGAAVALYILLIRKLNRRWNRKVRFNLTSGIIKITIAAAFSAGASALVISGAGPVPGLIRSMVFLCLGGGTAGAVYLAGLRIMGLKLMQ